VVEIVGTAHVAEPIPADDIAAIQRLIQSESSYRAYPYQVEEGRIVKVIRGPLEGLQGRLIRHTTRLPSYPCSGPKLRDLQEGARVAKRGLWVYPDPFHRGSGGIGCHL
jgi:hypothetical protein